MMHRTQGKITTHLLCDYQLNYSSFDGFAINIGDPSGSWIKKPMSQLFKYAETTNFKLFFSLDLYAANNACTSGSHGACGGVS